MSNRALKIVAEAFEAFIGQVQPAEDKTGKPMISIWALREKLLTPLKDRLEKECVEIDEDYIRKWAREHPIELHELGPDAADQEFLNSEGENDRRQAIETMCGCEMCGPQGHPR